MSMWISAVVLSMVSSFTAAAEDAPVAKLAECTKLASSDIESMQMRAVRIETMAASGSGVLISSDGWILTAAHVVGGAKKVKVVFADGSELDGAVLRRSDAADSALVHVDATNLPCAGMAAPVTAGTDLLAIGSPLGAALEQSVTKGIASANRELGSVTLVQTDAAVNPGNSGGPLFDADGKLVGIISFKLGGIVEGVAFAVQIDSVLDALGIELAEQSDAEVSNWVDDTPPEEPAPDVTVTLTKRPPESERGSPITKKPCKNYEVQISPFDDTRSFTTEIWDLYKLEFSSGGLANVAFYYPLETYGAPSDMASMLMAAGTEGEPTVTLQILLRDGTLVTIDNAKLQAAPINVYSARFLVQLSMEPEVVEAFASSPPSTFQWEVLGRNYLQEKTEGHGEKYYRAAFSCLHHQLQTMESD